MNLDELKQLAEANRTRIQLATGLAIAVGALAVLTVGGLLGSAVVARTKSAQPAAVAAAVVPEVTFPEVVLEAKAAVVYDLETNTVLYGLHEETPLPLASITKLLTVHAALENLSPADTLTVTAADSSVAEGTAFAVEDLIRLALVASSNAAAQTLGDAVAQVRTEQTSAFMAGVASAVGLLQTHATNPTGLDESVSVAGGYGSALDAARLAAAVFTKAPQLASGTAEPVVTVASRDGRLYTRPNTNVITNEIPGLLFSKTGYTDWAGGNLVVVIDAGINHRIAVAVLGSTETGRFSDVARLVEATRTYLGEYYAVQPSL